MGGRPAGAGDAAHYFVRLREVGWRGLEHARWSLWTARFWSAHNTFAIFKTTTVWCQPPELADTYRYPAHNRKAFQLLSLLSQRDASCRSNTQGPRSFGPPHPPPSLPRTGGEVPPRPSLPLNQESRIGLSSIECIDYLVVGITSQLKVSRGGQLSSSAWRRVKSGIGLGRRKQCQWYWSRR